jgi:hypothetical protein
MYFFNKGDNKLPSPPAKKWMVEVIFKGYKLLLNCALKNSGPGKHLLTRRKIVKK